MEYDHREILPEDYRNREERPRRRGVVCVSGLPPPGFDRPANDRERNCQWRDDLQTEPLSTARR